MLNSSELYASFICLQVAIEAYSNFFLFQGRTLYVSFDFVSLEESFFFAQVTLKNCLNRQLGFYSRAIRVLPLPCLMVERSNFFFFFSIGARIGGLYTDKSAKCTALHELIMLQVFGGGKGKRHNSSCEL